MMVVQLNSLLWRQLNANWNVPQIINNLFQSDVIRIESKFADFFKEQLQTQKFTTILVDTHL